MEEILKASFLLCSLNANLQAAAVDPKQFPNNFQFGIGISAYQVEGAWNESGKGENIWDRFVHEHPENIDDHSTGDIACDFYYKFKEDVVLLKDLGVDFFRFSLSWSRIFPTGRSYKVNPDGVRYYNELIDQLLVNDIKPMVTLFHWDLPQPLQDLGGMANSEIIELFFDFANFAFESFGDRVKLWSTFNDPRNFCVPGYGEGTHAPFINSSGIGEYLCGHNILKAHARAYHLYHEKYLVAQGGRIGITVGTLWFEPSSNDTKDTDAANRAMEFELGKWANPIFSSDGDYPQIVKEYIASRSKEEGFQQSRLPEFTQEEMKNIAGTYDYFGFNFYSARLTADIDEEPTESYTINRDLRYKTWADPTWDSFQSSQKVVPWALQKALKWIKEQYNNPEIVITENGFPEAEVFNDQGRIRYLQLHLESLLNSILTDNVRVTMYSVWTLMDNFEWSFGYTKRFGLYYVNFSDPDLPRTAKASAEFYKMFIAMSKEDSSTPLTLQTNENSSLAFE